MITISQNTIIFREENKPGNLTLQESDSSLLQLLESFQNENDCASAATASLVIVSLKAGIIDTYCNEFIVDNRVDGNDTSA